MKIIEYQDKYRDQVIKLIFGILENEFKHYSKSSRPDIKNIPDFYQGDEKSNFWVALDENGNVIGTVALKKLNDECANFRRFYVKKERRGTGVAKELFSEMLRFAKEKQYKTLFLSTWEDTTAAQNFTIKTDLKESQARQKMLRGAQEPILYFTD